MELTLLRHTRVDLGEGICYGASDVALMTDHADDFHRLATALPARARRIVSSPLKRCRLLAEHLAEGAPVAYDERLRELDFGAWELRAWNDIPPEEYRAWGDDWVNEAPPGGESLRAMAARVQACLDELIAADEDTLVVSHGGPIRAMLSKLLGLTLREGTALPVDHGHFYHLRRDGDTWTRLAANQG